MLELRDVSAGYGSQIVLRDIDLVVPDRSVVGLLGPNGAGKTPAPKAGGRPAATPPRPGHPRWGRGDVVATPPTVPGRGLLRARRPGHLPGAERPGQPAP